MLQVLPKSTASTEQRPPRLTCIANRCSLVVLAGGQGLLAVVQLEYLRIQVDTEIRPPYLFSGRGRVLSFTMTAQREAGTVPQPQIELGAGSTGASTGTSSDGGSTCCG